MADRTRRDDKEHKGSDDLRCAVESLEENSDLESHMSGRFDLGESRHWLYDLSEFNVEAGDGFPLNAAQQDRRRTSASAPSVRPPK